MTVTVDSIGAILLISDDAEGLAHFYRDALGFPLDNEDQEVPRHYGCDVGGVHFAIHPSQGWPGEQAPKSQSPVLVFSTSDLQSAYERLGPKGVPATPPFDHGFALLTAFEDPDGHNVQLMTPAA